MCLEMVKRFLISVFGMFLIVGYTLPSSVAANSESTSNYLNEVKSNQITNFVMIDDSNSMLKYTYTANGQSYLVEEKFVNDKKVVSKIFVKNQKTGKYKKEDVITTSYLENEGTVVQTNESFEVISNVDIDSMKSVIEKNTEAYDDLTQSLNLSASSYTPWTYSSTSYGNSTPTKWLVGAIGITIAAITKVPATVKWVTNIANLTFQLYNDKVYYKYVSYHRGSGLTSEVMTHRYVYTTSSYSKALGYSVTVSGRTGMQVVSTVTL